MSDLVKKKTKQIKEEEPEEEPEEKQNPQIKLYGGPNEAAAQLIAHLRIKGISLPKRPEMKSQDPFNSRRFRARSLEVLG